MRHVHEICIACAYRVHGVCMAGAWLVHGVCMACAWYVRRAYVTVEQLAGERGKAVAAPMRRDERCEIRASAAADAGYLSRTPRHACECG